MGDRLATGATGGFGMQDNLLGAKAALGTGELHLSLALR
jgi:hypothetical protein